MSDQQKVTYLGKVDYRNKQLTFGIKERDRTRHMYVIGKTGMGKSTFLENLAIQDINNGEGVCFIDPHGSTAEKLLDFIPEHRVKDVIYFAPFDSEYPVGLNILEQVDVSKRHLVANGLMAAFKKIFGEERFSDRIQYILNNIILALLENEGQSLLGVNRMLTDKEYRKFIVSNIKDPSVKAFWEEEFVKAGEKYQQEAAPGIQNKIGQFISNPLIRNIIGQHKTSFNIRDVMDNKKILIVNLSKGKVGEGNADLIGSLIITKIYLAAMSRADAGSKELDKLPSFYFYVDEFQNFANESFASILSESRKYKLALTVAHQYIEQMEDEVRAAVFGNVGTMVTFRVGATDAEVFEKEFAPYFTMDDIVNLSAFQVYLRLMIDGVGSKPFSAHTLDPVSAPPHSYAQDVINFSRYTYGRPLKEVQEEVSAFYLPKVYTPPVKEEPKRSVPVADGTHSPSFEKRDGKPPYRSEKTEYKQTPNKEYTKPYQPRSTPPVQVVERVQERQPDRQPERQQERPQERYQERQSERPQEKVGEKVYEKQVVQEPRKPEERSVERVYEQPKKEWKREERTAEQPRAHIAPTFDDKPAMSLKDALSKALAEKKIEEKVPEKVQEVQQHEVEEKKPEKIQTPQVAHTPRVVNASQVAHVTQTTHNAQVDTKKPHKKDDQQPIGHNVKQQQHSQQEAKKKNEIPEDILRKIIGE
jgi:hypothetical protein